MPSWTAGKLVSSRPAGGGGGLGGTSGDRTISVSGRMGATRVERRAGRSLGAGGGWAAASDGPSAAITRARRAIPIDDARSLVIIITAPRRRMPRLQASGRTSVWAWDPLPHDGGNPSHEPWDIGPIPGKAGTRLTSADLVGPWTSFRSAPETHLRNRA